MVCTGANCTFAIKTFFFNGEYAIAKVFRARYMLGWNDAVPDRKSILLLVANFRVTYKVST